MLDRRQLVQLASVVSASVWLPRSAWSQTRWSSNPFALGVASGSPSHDSVVLWTRLVQPDRQPLLTPDVAVQWEVAHDDQFRHPVASGQSVALAQLGHCVHVEVPNLAPDRWYFYRFLSGDALSATGRTRTFPAPGATVSRLRLSYASCQHWEHGYFAAHRHMRDEHLDLVMFLGDYIYEYAAPGSAVRPGGRNWLVTLDDYRSRYALYKSDLDLQAMHAACPWLVVWDDHEVQNDYAGATPGDKGPTVASFAARRAAAYQAFYEHMPLRASVLTRGLGGLATGAEMRIYGSATYGKLAHLMWLDDRQYRDAQVCTKDGKRGSSAVNPAQCSTWNDAQRSLLGEAQEQWVDLAFSRSQAQWNVLAQQTAFGQRDSRSGAGQSLSNDGWDGYATARHRLLQSVQRYQLPGLVVLGGDIHANWVGHVKADYSDPASATVGVEFCGTSISSHGGSNDKLASQLRENPHFVFADRAHRGYGVVEFTPTQLTTTLRVVDDVTRADSGISTLAQFVVEAGGSQLERTI